MLIILALKKTIASNNKKKFHPLSTPSHWIIQNFTQLNEVALQFSITQIAFLCSALARGKELFALFLASQIE